MTTGNIAIATHKYIGYIIVLHVTGHMANKAAFDLVPEILYTIQAPDFVKSHFGAKKVDNYHIIFYYCKSIKTMPIFIISAKTLSFGVSQNFMSAMR